MKNIENIKNWLSGQLIHTQTWIISIPKRNWVSFHARKLIKTSRRPEPIRLSERISTRWFSWMHPAQWRISFLLAVMVVFLPQSLAGILFGKILVTHRGFRFLDTDFLSIAMQVLASVIGISFVLVVFITEHSQGRGYERRAFPVYASATSMIFTVIVGLLTLVNMGISLAFLKSGFTNNLWVLGASLWNSILLFFNLVLVLFLYIRTYQLLSPNYFRKILIAYHRRKVLERVYLELYKRVKQNMSLHFIEELGIQSSTFRHDNPGRVGITIREDLEETYTIEDINLDLISFSAKNAKKLAKSFQKEQFIFLGLPGRNLTKEYPEIASVSPELDQKQIVLPLKSAIRISPWKSRKLDSASDDLLINRDLISTAITSGQAENVESSLSLYTETIDAFLNSLQQLGHRFTPELTNRESTWFNRWDIFESVRNQYVSLLREAIKSNQAEIINEFIGFPTEIMVKALQYRDHFAFRQFADLYSLIYSFAKQYISDARASDLVANRCGQLLVQFSDYWIRPKLKKEIPFEEAKELIAYVEHILSVLNQLAKYQIDFLDIKHYKLTIGSMRRLLNDFIGQHDDYSLDHIKMQLQYAADEAARIDLQLQLQKAIEFNSLATKLETNRQSMFIGLGAWICHLIDKGEISSDVFRDFFELLGKSFQGLNQLHKSYSHALELDNRGQFGWHGWEMDEWPDEAYGEAKAGTIHFNSWLSFYYTLRALELTAENPDSIPEINPSSNIKGTLDSIKADFKHFLENKNWEPIIKSLGNFNLRVQILEKAHEAAYKKQLEIEEFEIAQTPISDKKSKEFFKEMEEEWQKSGLGRNLFIAFGRYSPRQNATPPKELLPFGIYERTPKGAFIEQPRIGYSGWGRSYGNSIARGEDQHISMTFNNLPSISATLEDFDNVILENISLLRSKGFNPIILYGRAMHMRFFESKNYEPQWRTTKIGPKGLENLEGFYEDTVVVRFPINSSSIVIYDPAEFAELAQYKVDENKPDFPLSFSVKEISRERAKEYLVKNPELGKHPETEADLSEEEALRRIQQGVELAILQRFNIDNVNPKSGIVINFDSAKSKEEKPE